MIDKQTASLLEYILLHPGIVGRELHASLGRNIPDPDDLFRCGLLDCPSTVTYRGTLSYLRKYTISNQGRAELESYKAEKESRRLSVKNIRLNWILTIIALVIAAGSLVVAILALSGCISPAQVTSMPVSPQYPAATTVAAYPPVYAPKSN